ncbi:hypothetical protein LC653_18065 [Nostoc sp. CHAB 5784]|uniref:hypothetical protein n=1 Tax=Nostoc mirabile TaxID=2907820 RepID=UPI001E5C22E6|nr:hypothetical protein [Nostoc mirabile]MCC5665775.1 hypothetical protein [Nostoc mirabile CHAB5784]
MSKSVYAIAGVVVGLVVNLVGNLLSAAIQQQVFSDKFSRQSTWWLVGCLLVGALVGWWLGEKIQVPAPTATPPQPTTGNPGTQQTTPVNPDKVTMTRLGAIASVIKSRGSGVRLSDIFTLGSKIDIDTRD